jgi:hypothetical protein
MRAKVKGEWLNNKDPTFSQNSGNEGKKKQRTKKSETKQRTKNVAIFIPNVSLQFCYETIA